MVSTAGIVIIATPKSSCAGTAARKITRNICGGMNWLCAISIPRVMSVRPVAISATAATDSASADGLKMWRDRPSSCQRMNSLPA